MIEVIRHPRTNKEVNIKDLKVVSYSLPNKQGKKRKTKCVEFVVIGNNSEWIDWSFYREFKKINQHINI